VTLIGPPHSPVYCGRFVMLKKLSRAVLPASLRDWFHWQRLLWNCAGFGPGDLERAYGEICSGLDLARLRALREGMRATRERDPRCPAKYYDVEHWLRIALCNAARLGLHRRRGLRILDLGCGPGWFMAACRHFGHEVDGLDLPYGMMDDVSARVYRELTDFLGFGDRVQETRIEALKAMPLRGEYDVIVAFLVCFNNHKQPDTWGAREWRFFLDDAAARLRPGGRLFMQLNSDRPRFGKRVFYDAETLELFAARGQVRGKMVDIRTPSAPRHPVSAVSS